MVALFSFELRRSVGMLLAVACLSACALGQQVLGGPMLGGHVRMGPVAKMLRPQPDLCGAAALIDVVGQPFTLLADHQLVGPLRVLWPGQEITDEVVPTRLNAEVTHDQLILRLSCG